jgi:hypothetical protein
MDQGDRLTSPQEGLEDQDYGGDKEGMEHSQQEQTRLHAGDQCYRQTDSSYLPGKGTAA